MTERKRNFSFFWRDKVGECFAAIEGWVIKEVDFASTQNGTERVSFTIASNKISKSIAYGLQQDMPETEASFIRVTAFGFQAKRLKAYGIESKQLFIFGGRLKMSEYNGYRNLELIVDGFVPLYKEGGVKSTSTGFGWKSNINGVAHAFMVGYVSQDLELRYVQDKAVANFSIGVNYISKQLNYLLGGGIPDTDSTFIRCSVWENVATRAANYGIEKGQLIAVGGKLSIREYEASGQRRKSIELVGHDFKPIKKAGSNANNASNYHAPAPETTAPTTAPTTASFTAPPQVDVNDDLPF